MTFLKDYYLISLYKLSYKLIANILIGLFKEFLANLDRLVKGGFRFCKVYIG